MPKYYSKIILCLICTVIVINVVYFFYTQPNISHKVSYQSTQYTPQHVEGALQPLPLISSIDTDWVLLGKSLFNSTLLSADNSVSCASCHKVLEGGDDDFSVSIGINNKAGSRNSPTVLNSSLNFRQFWDGRSRSLAKQAREPIHNPVEMGSNFKEIIKKLKEDTTFNQIFNKLDKEGITEKNIIKAIVTYQESLITNNSPIDNYLLGDKDALTVKQKRGLTKFTQFGCISCHQGRNIGGNLYQKLGRINDVPAHLLEDGGRYNVTDIEQDLHVFKVPSLRNVALTAPYFHNGSIETLPEAVHLMGKMQLGITLSDNDVEDIVALLHSFTGKVTELGIQL